jgi:hypothetical protein
MIKKEVHIKPLNLDGLVDGKIPRGKPCPWLSLCQLKNEDCPTIEHPNENDLSCGMAILRSISTVDTSKYES